jgi:hypothetical protein
MVENSDWDELERRLEQARRVVPNVDAVTPERMRS